MSSTSPATPGCRSPATALDKVNVSHVYGGAGLQAHTLATRSGSRSVRDRHQPGFISMVDDTGGINVNVPEAMDDPDSGANFPPGMNHSDGHQASRSPPTVTSS